MHALLIWKSPQKKRIRIFTKCGEHFIEITTVDGSIDVVKYVDHSATFGGMIYRHIANGWEQVALG